MPGPRTMKCDSVLYNDVLPCVHGGWGVGVGGAGGVWTPLPTGFNPPTPAQIFPPYSRPLFFPGIPPKIQIFLPPPPAHLTPPPPTPTPTPPTHTHTAHFLSKAPPTPIPMLPSRMQQCCFNVMCILVFTKYFLFLYHCCILSKIKLTTATCKSLYSVSLPGLWRFVRWLWYLPVNHVGWSWEIAKQNNISTLCHHWFR